MSLFGRKKLDDPNEAKSFLFLNRRANVRVNYPKVDIYGSLPNVFYGPQSVKPRNISSGGLLLEWNSLLSNLSPGFTVELDFKWQGGEKVSTLGFDLLRTTQGGHHLKLLEISPSDLVELILSLRAGATGQGLLCLSKGPKEEHWKGLKGEEMNIHFENKNIETAWIKFGNTTLERQGPGLWTKGGEALTPSELSDLLVIFANIVRPTIPILEMLTELEDQLRATR